MHGRSSLWVACTCVLALAAGLLVAVHEPLPDLSNRPKLIVMVVFDQMRGDYPARWNTLFGPDGFRRLEREGTWFTNCHYPYGVTITGPGHASLATGCSPDRHGIVSNEWFEPYTGETCYCATHPRYEVVLSWPPPPKPADPKKAANAKPEKPRAGGTPDRLLAPTFADALKTATGGKAKVVALSMKDRSSVLPGGRRPNACYWFDERTGTFGTSTYYRDRPAPWVTAFNRERRSDRWFGTEWTRVRPDLDYVPASGPDDAPTEGTGVLKLQGRVFPHPMSGGLKSPGKDYYDTLYSSPFGNELLLAFVKRAIEEENLGHGVVPDFLSVSFSCNDPVGHLYGPDSQEVLDVTLRSDEILRDLLTTLDRRVGAGNYVLGLSADHGVCPFPEMSAARGIEARRLDPAPVTAAAGAYLSEQFGVVGEKANWFEKQNFPWVYLNRKLLASRGLSEHVVSQALVGWVKRQPWALTAYSRQELAGALPADDAIGRRMQKSYFAERCGDVAIVTKPYYLFSTSKTGTVHGTPHPYDTHVPLMVIGPGIPAGRSDEPVTPQGMAAIFAHWAGVPPPAMAEAPLPDRLKPR